MFQSVDWVWCAAAQAFSSPTALLQMSLTLLATSLGMEVKIFREKEKSMKYN